MGKKSKNSRFVADSIKLDGKTIYAAGTKPKIRKEVPKLKKGK